MLELAQTAESDFPAADFLQSRFGNTSLHSTKTWSSKVDDYLSFTRPCKHLKKHGILAARSLPLNFVTLQWRMFTQTGGLPDKRALRINGLDLAGEISKALVRRPGWRATVCPWLVRRGEVGYGARLAEVSLSQQPPHDEQAEEKDLLGGVEKLYIGLFGTSGIASCSQ